MALVAMARTSKPDALDRVLGHIEDLGLSVHLAEMEARGFTVLKGVLSAGQIARARAAIIARVERKTGKHVDLDDENGDAFRGMQYIPYLLYDDPVFEEILLAERPLALMTYLLGESCLLSSMGCHFRGPGGAPLMLHSDNGNGTPPPFSPNSFVANMNYALTPYSREAGALVMVPGSHRLQRQPTAHENFLIKGLSARETFERVRDGKLTDVEWADPPGIETMNIAPGDVVVWHGNTWHGSHRRDLPGVRMNLAVYMCRQFVQRQEYHDAETRKTVVARHANNPRMATLLGAKQPYGWREEGMDYALAAQNPRGLFD